MEEKNYVLLTASSNVGIGLWTSICVFFAKIFGVTSHNLQNKQRRVASSLKKQLEKQFEALPEGEYELKDFRIVFSSTLAATASAVAIKK